VVYSTKSVLQDFADDGVVYLELRTTPREFPETGLTKEAYVETVLSAIEEFNSNQSSMKTYLILSVDRRDTPEKAEACVDLALKYKHRGILGVDLCGNPVVNLSLRTLVKTLSVCLERRYPHPPSRLPESPSWRT
jgi:adenosine deaminase